MQRSPSSSSSRGRPTDAMATDAMHDSGGALTWVCIKLLDTCCRPTSVFRSFRGIVGGLHVRVYSSLTALSA